MDRREMLKFVAVSSMAIAVKGGIANETKDSQAEDRFAAPAKPSIRAIETTDAGGTMDWTQVGGMDRISLRNEGPYAAWIAFDINGPAVDAFTSDFSFKIQVNESINMTRCVFDKIGAKCKAGEFATLHAIAFKEYQGELK